MRVNLTVPAPLKDEHDALRDELAALIGRPGAVGAAARAVATALQEHFAREKNYALPPLSLLPEVARGAFTTEMGAVTAMTDNLKAQLPIMLAEHRRIAVAAAKLADAGRQAGEPAASRFAKKLLAHARIAELVLYPAAILVGETVRRRMRERAPAIL